MLAVVKTPRTKIKIEGDIPKPILKVLKLEFGKNLKIKEEPGDELVDLFDTDWFKDRKKKITPGKTLRTYRENKGWNQEKLGKKLGGFSRQYISDLENGRREISKNLAKTLSKLFQVSPVRFI